MFSLLLSPLAAIADAVEIDGIYYNLVKKAKTAEVTKNPYKYSGAVVIPATVDYDGVTYDVTSIGGSAFYDCQSLTSVTIPNSVTTIGNNVFQSCSRLTSVTIPNSVTSIGSYAFNDCYSLFSVTIPNSVTSIGDSAFRGCSGLTSVTIPNSVTSIGNYAFYSCSGLTSVTIPNSVTSIKNSAFAVCSGLTSVTIPNSVTSIGYGAFSVCRGLTSVTIGNSVTYIGERAFSGCRGLTSVTIPNSVTLIGKDAFANCSGLTFINIGSGVETIYSKAFASCPELMDVYCYVEKIPSMMYIDNPCTDAFEGSYIEYATLHVPAALVNEYRQTEPWSGFGIIVATDADTPEEPESPKCSTPTISYLQGQLTFECETEGVEYVYEIKDTDIKKGYTNKVDLTVTYSISVFATKSGYQNSEVASATLCWIDVTPTGENVVVGQAEVRAMPVLIECDGGVLTIKGVAEGTPISVYDTAGRKVGSATATAQATRISATLRNGDIGIIRIGDKAVKIAIK